MIQLRKNSRSVTETLPTPGKEVEGGNPGFPKRFVLLTGELGRRIVTILVIIVLTYLGIFSRYGIHLFFAVVSLLIFFSQREFYRIIERAGVRASWFWGLLSGFLLSVSGYAQFFMSDQYRPLLVVIPLSALFISTFAIQMRRMEVGGVLRIASTHFGVLYVAAPLASMFWTLRMNRGQGLILLLLVATGFNDIGAYVIGKTFGRHRMAPRISPKKTWEGVVGGVLFSLIAVLIGGVLYKEIGQRRFFYFLPPPHGVYHALVLTLIIDVFGLLGDLAESVLKREVGLKDSGGTLTGHGGFLDMCDSLLFTAPVVLIYAILILPRWPGYGPG